LRGGPGNDTYVVRGVNDSIIELPGEGTDTVRVWGMSYTLGPNLENLELMVGIVNGTGNELANTIIGTAAANVLNGGAGNDVLVGGLDADRLTGGSGSDRFDYNSIAEGLDTITDFTRGSTGDKLDIKDVLVGYKAATSNIDDFVRLSGATSTIVAVNADGAGTDFVPLATLSNVAMSAVLLSEMLGQNNLLVV
jgi:Ca2+-binding RTX toxin-like protein